MVKQIIGDNILFKKLIENSYTGITLFDDKFNIIYRSPSAEHINGWDTKDRIKNTIPELTHPSDKGMVDHLLQKVLANPDHPMTCTFRSLHANGSYIWLECTFTNNLNDDDINAIICNFRDITERKHAELELERKNEQLQNLIGSITDGFIALDENMCYTYVNDQMGKMLGHEPKSLLGKNIWEVFPDAVGSATYDAIQTVYREKKYVCNEDYYPLLNLWQENRVYPSGKGVLVFIRDITKRKNEEQRLKLFESVITHASDAVMITEAGSANESGPRIIYVNDAFEKMTGYSPDEIIGKTPRILQGPKSDKAELKRLGDCIRRFETCEVAIINYKKNGEEFWVNFTVNAVANSDGKTTHYIAIERDVTDYKNEELQKTLMTEAINAALDERNTILESIGDAFFAVDKNWIVTYWNSMAEKVLHKTKCQMFNQNLWEIFSDSVGSKSYKKYHEAIRTNKAVYFEDYYEPFNQWYEVSAYPSANGLSVYFTDITERKTTTSSLEESQKNYSKLFHLSPLPNWVFDVNSLRFLDVNDAAIKLYGYTREEFLSMTIKDIRPVDEVAKLEKTVAQNKLKQQKTKLGIFNHVTKSGEIIQVDMQSNNIQYGDRSAKIVVAFDVTERLKYIKAIEEQNNKLREISWMQSHIIRAPLARIMGLIPLIKGLKENDADREAMLEFLELSANELDEVIKEISQKTTYSDINKNCSR
jgi:PAS domain S-box-containing protein